MWINYDGTRHKQTSRGVLRKTCPENMQQIYWRTPMPKCDFKWHFGMGVLLQICCIFSEHLFLRTPPEGSFCLMKTKFYLQVHCTPLKFYFSLWGICNLNKFTANCCIKCHVKLRFMISTYNSYFEFSLFDVLEIKNVFQKLGLNDQLRKKGV